MKAWGKTNIGRTRTENQDSFFLDIMPEADMILCVVCDGMGGAKAGGVASEFASSVFIENMRSKLRMDMSVEYISEIISESVAQANIKVYEKSLSDKAYEGMGTTLVSAVLMGKQVVIGHVGDSRAYLLRPDGITRLTRDHSLVEDMVRMGDITEEEARNHPNKNLLTRAIGTTEEEKCDITIQEVNDGDFLLLCTDGLSSMVEEQEMLDEVYHGGEKQEICDRLINIANSRGGRDNITVVLIEV